MLWIQRKRKRKTVSESAPDEHEPPEGHKAKNEDWIKSHFSRLSEEKLATCSNSAAASSSATTPRPKSGMIKETHKESGKSSSTDEATWAAVAACTKEIDTKGQQLANSMLQRAMAYQNSGHLESKDINQEELKALEEVEMKLKGNFLTQRETSVAGANHTHTFHGHGQHGHQSHPSHQSHSLPNRSHQTYHPFEAT
ncbi:hypothetical protein HPG69_019642 [Diceros bicornis minor]|uniref:Uncharacterized protein n=1 Tax=Diceros bicornis minor TaxID=77932 RepID=A0A7J7E6M9_DICBM|nr:hypothetical protein HPG69_019642 [Diceros bicornis minor]